MAKCRYYKMCWLRLGYDCDEWNPDCRGGGDAGCKRFEPMPNVKALLKLERDIAEDAADIEKLQLGVYGSCYLTGIAKRIRKALGVER